ncbi:hypothetical protein Metvu_0314 [Methanocaldococcus vulcanius M7]|uniref:Uncharacterized protein n=1 Tax=Methanocaldococcus vulcanius (strain ATCC 700851 / DSM 12094 / M7) TaxID=579137 RepID=C9RF29_METVM|nr:hypothetical protein Metvu_0314 [Methanocaldococcus vulcanius M7]
MEKFTLETLNLLKNKVLETAIYLEKNLQRFLLKRSMR